MIATKSVKPALQLTYVKLMMDVIGRGLVMASQVDDEVKQEVSKFPENFTFYVHYFGVQFCPLDKLMQHILILMERMTLLTLVT